MNIRQKYLGNTQKGETVDQSIGFFLGVSIQHQIKDINSYPNLMPCFEERVAGIGHHCCVGRGFTELVACGFKSERQKQGE
jgi:hypothetical protein